MLSLARLPPLDPLLPWPPPLPRTDSGTPAAFDALAAIIRAHTGFGRSLPKPDVLGLGTQKRGALGDAWDEQCAKAFGRLMGAHNDAVIAPVAVESSSAHVASKPHEPGSVEASQAGDAHSSGRSASASGGARAGAGASAGGAPDTDNGDVAEFARRIGAVPAWKRSFVRLVCPMPTSVARVAWFVVILLLFNNGVDVLLSTTGEMLIPLILVGTFFVVSTFLGLLHSYFRASILAVRLAGRVRTVLLRMMVAPYKEPSGQSLSLFVSLAMAVDVLTYELPAADAPEDDVGNQSTIGLVLEMLSFVFGGFWVYSVMKQRRTAAAMRRGVMRAGGGPTAMVAL